MYHPGYQAPGPHYAQAPGHIAHDHRNVQRAIPAGQVPPVAPPARANAPPAFVPPPPTPGYLAAKGDELPIETEVWIDNGTNDKSWLVAGFNPQTRCYILKCPQGRRPTTEQPLPYLKVVPKERGFTAILEPLGGYKVLVHLIGNNGMTASDALSLLAPQLGCAPELLILSRGGRRLQSHATIHVNETVVVTMAPPEKEQNEAVMDNDALDVKTPSDGVGFCAGLGHNCHCTAFCSGGMVWVAIAILIGLKSTGEDLGARWSEWCSDNKPDQVNPAEIAFILLLLGYLWHLIDSCGSDSCAFLSNIKTGQGAHDLVNKVKGSAPEITWRIECYHMEHRTRIKTRRVKNYNGQWVNERYTEHYEEKVVTHRNSRKYRYDAWEDVSGDLPPLDDFKFTQLTIGKKWLFADDITERDYYDSKDRWVARNDRDVSYDLTTSLDIDHYIPKVLAEITPGQMPCWMNNCCFWIANLLSFSWFFRACFTAKSGQRTFNVVKRIRKEAPIVQAPCFFMPQITVIQIAVPPVYTQPGMVYAQQPNVSINIQGGANVEINM